MISCRCQSVQEQSSSALTVFTSRAVETTEQNRIVPVQLHKTMSSIPTSKTIVAILVLLSIWIFIYFVPTLPEGNQWVDHTTKVPDESKGNQWVEHTTRAPNESYPLVDYKPFRLKYGPKRPFQALNLTRIKNELIDKVRLKKPQDQQGPHYENAVVCGCYKCGTTSFYTFLFQQIFDRSYSDTTLEENGGEPWWPQRTVSQGWQGVFEKPIPVKEAKKVLSSPYTFSLAIVREPISRLVSAWKNKMACSEKTPDLKNRENRTKKLLKLSGMPLPKHIEENSKYCLEFPEFVEALRLVHSKGKQDYLDHHFLPQHLFCFRTVEPSDWMHIVPPGDPSIGPLFANLLGLKDTNVTLAKENSSSKKEVLEISDHDMSILKAITADERAMIEPLLKQ